MSVFLKKLAAVVLLCLLNQAEAEPGADETSPATLYFNGEILTMVGKAPAIVQALVERDGKIAFSGTLAEARTRAGEAAQTFDLAGQTLMPGFIEPHLHPSIAAIMLQNEIIAPYDWRLLTTVKRGVSGEQAYRQRVSQSIAANANADELYFIWGYHQLWHGDLSRGVLNDLAGDQPVAIIHRSFHEVFLNDAAIAKLGIQREDFIKNPQVDWEKGHFYEGGWLALAPRIVPTLVQPEKYRQGLATMSALLQANGITTIAEPGFPSTDFDTELFLLHRHMASNPPQDVYLIANGTQLSAMKGGNEEALAFIESLPAYNRSNVKFLPKQVKLFADGAIYSQLMQMKGGYTDGHQGEWMTPPSLLAEQMQLYWSKGYRIHTHANGDLGQQVVIDRVKQLQQSMARKDHRFTLHHMGYFTDDMAQQMAELGMEASVNPYYLWALADKYADSGLGAERAQNLVAIKSLVDRGIPVSFHSDFSMAPVEPLTLAWTAVNRVTSQGSRFSQAQRISVYQALRAITADAARTLNLEHEIGTLETGKTANFTLLAENPLTVEPMRLKDIRVAGVVYRGTFYGNQ